MKTLLKSFLLFIPLLSLGQVGINTIDPKADLEIVAAIPGSPTSETGMLIPRINNFPNTNPGVAQHSMLVYLSDNVTRNITGSNQFYERGFYYWDNNLDNWIPFNNSSVSGDGWQTEGNSGLSSNSNFIGTTDNVELNFRVNNQEIFRMSNKGQLEILSNVNNILIGKNAGETISGGRENVIIGQDSDVNGTGFRETVLLGNGLTAYGNNATVIGSNDSRATTDGIAIGRAAKSTATEAISIGYLSEATRNGAISIGKGAITKTSESISIGVNAKVESNFDRSIALGVNANVTKDNQLMLSNDIKEVSAEQATIRARQFVATASNSTYADYVFDMYYDGTSDLNKTYNFPTLEEAESFTKANGHLIGVKSIEDIQSQGMTVDVAETSLKNLEKIEEQFLYITELNSKIKEQNKRIEDLEALLNKVIELKQL
ncbi:hypothetical protein LY01_02197 [Nonlabens xylanidelens]|uniref:Trimeric autotransporter adhesin n=1 Tax=Nonlabens xylanidelens TaxID=191564 RepID=A0A2S6IIG2_9FLAO|nr:hypothetical protein [Nonlabens xylanidelens]PPK93975.1 hypothetical protein LY01_02197 [Nonlabens xylanidelens]PQJ22131.1 hypothetical protein BST94_00705 [Nonlabens xylanidelens]